MKIIIESIPESSHRYPTCGDYWTDEDGTEHIVVSEMKDKRFMRAVALHEIFEKWLTEEKGITEQDITNFDINFEVEKESGLHGDMEPGDHINSPYREQHCMALELERKYIEYCGLNWMEYDKALLSGELAT